MKEYIVRAIAQETIDSFDAHNAPELIRCKDCKHGDLYNGGTAYYCEKDIGTMETAVHEPDWFCADGKRG